MKQSARQRGLAALGAGVTLWTVQLGLMFGLGYSSVLLVVLGTLSLALGATLIVWGESFEKMPPAQKLPAALISLATFGLVAALLARWLGVFSAR